MQVNWKGEILLHLRVCIYFVGLSKNNFRNERGFKFKLKLFLRVNHRVRTQRGCLAQVSFYCLARSQLFFLSPVVAGFHIVRDFNCPVHVRNLHSASAWLPVARLWLSNEYWRVAYSFPLWVAFVWASPHDTLPVTQFPFRASHNGYNCILPAANTGFEFVTSVEALHLYRYVFASKKFGSKIWLLKVRLWVIRSLE